MDGLESLAGLGSLPEWITASGALGAAAYGLVEALKGSTGLGCAGMGPVDEMLGQPGKQALKFVYGDDGKGALLRDSWRRGGEATAQLLRNGLKIGLSEPASNGDAPAAALAKHFGQDGARLAAAVALLQQATADSADSQEMIDARTVLGRFELAVDARIDGALAAAKDRYASVLTLTAAVIAVGAGTGVGFWYDWVGDSTHSAWWQGLLVGLFAVPLAPVTKDVVTLLRSATRAISLRASP